uniref:Uncharacterized protein n=1 Tax=Wuchereria bancrofti TaxID=6293 RepID=A0AAF5PZT3_WUCBA
MANLADSVTTQMKKVNIDVESQCFATEEFKNGSEMCRPSMNSNSDRAQIKNYKGVTTSEMKLIVIIVVLTKSEAVHNKEEVSIIFPILKDMLSGTKRKVGKITSGKVH